MKNVLKIVYLILFAIWSFNFLYIIVFYKADDRVLILGSVDASKTIGVIAYGLLSAIALFALYSRKKSDSQI
jgi:hypothetical protein